MSLFSCSLASGTISDVAESLRHGPRLAEVEPMGNEEDYTTSGSGPSSPLLDI